MFIVSRFNLLFSCLVLLKIIIAVAKGIYSMVLKVCNEIEFSLKYGENSHFLQNERQRSRTLDFVDRNHHSGFVDFLIYNLPTRGNITVKHLRKDEATDSSQISCDNSQQRMTVQETSHPVYQEPIKGVDGETFSNPPGCYSPLVYVHTTSQDQVKLQNQENGIENVTKSLRNSQNGKHASNTKIFVKASDGSSLQLNTHYRNIKSQLDKSNQSKKETSESDPLNMPPQFVEHGHKLQSFPSEAATLRQRMLVDTTSRNNVERAYLDKRKIIQSSETQNSKDERNSDSHRVKNAFLSNYNATDHPLDESAVDCQNDENSYKETAYRNDVVAETSKKEVYLSYSKDDGRFASCSELYNSDETKQSSYNFWKNLFTTEFQDKEVPLETSKANNIQGSEGNLNHSKAAYVDKCNIERSSSPIQDDMSKIFHEMEFVEDIENRREGMKRGENVTEKDSYDSTNKSVARPDSSQMAKLAEDGRAAYFDFLVEVKPVILKIEDSIVSLFKSCQFRPLSVPGSDMEVLRATFEPLRVKSAVMNNYAYQIGVNFYINNITFLFLQLKEDQRDSAVNGKPLRGSSYLDGIRRTLVKRRELLYGGAEDLKDIFTEKKETPKASHRKNQKKRSRK